MQNKERPRYRRNRRLKQAKLQRKVKRAQKRLKLLRICLKVLIIVFLLIFGFVILKLPQWRLPADAFSLNSPALEIVNNRIVPSQNILAALRRNQVPAEPIFLVEIENLKKSIMQIEPVKDVYIRRFWFPARLKIIVAERTPAVTVSPDIGVLPVAFFSTDGKLIGREYMPLDESLNTVKVITYGSGDDYRNWDKTKVNNFKKLASMVEADSGEQVEYIDYRDPQDVYVKIPTVNIRLGNINSSVYDKIHRLQSLLPQVKMLNKKVKYIDLRWDTNYIKLDE